MFLLRGMRVHPRGDPERVGYVVVAGEQVSEVKFADGKYQYISNNNLVIRGAESEKKA